MRPWAPFSFCLLLWLGGRVLFGQAQPCLGGGKDPYLTLAPRPPRKAAPFELSRPLTMMEVGSRQVMGDRTAAKFGEYRDIPRGVFVNSLTSCSEAPGGGFYLRLRSRETVEMDQHSLLEAGLPGRLKITTAWDRGLHTLSTAGRNHFTQMGPGEFALPEGVAALQGTRPVNMQFRRNTARVQATVTPTEAWDLRMEYSRERRSGFRPVGANFSFSVVELPEPSDYRTHNLKFSAEMAKPAWLVRIDSGTSIFSDSVEALEWTNPFQDPGNSSSPVRGRKGLPPDNAAQTFSFAGAVDLPHSLRIVATVSPGWMTQDDPFLPFTTNSAIQAQPNFPALPASNLDGRKQTLMMNYLLTGKFGKQFAFNARYRSYELDNETPSLVFANYVRYDSVLPISSPFSPQARRSLSYAYRKQNVTLDWIWQRNEDSSAKVFYEWEGWDREYREVGHTDEHTVGGSWDMSKDEELLVRASFQHSLRRPNSYDPSSFLASFPEGMGPFELTQLPGLRRFDEAQRSRNYGDVLVEVTPTELLTFSAAYTIDRSFFDESAYGLLYDLNEAISSDVAYALTPTLSVFGNYTYERFRYAQRSRERLPVSFPAPINDSANNDWESNLRDRSHSWGGGLNASLFNHRVVADFYWSLSHSQSSTKTQALGNPLLAGFLVNTAEDYPDTNNRFQQWVVSVRFPLRQNVSQRLQYTYERFTERDLAAEQAGPLPGLPDLGQAGSIFLGPIFPRYRVHILSYTLSFVF